MATHRRRLTVFHLSLPIYYIVPLAKNPSMYYIVQQATNKNTTVSFLPSPIAKFIYELKAFYLTEDGVPQQRLSF